MKAIFLKNCDVPAFLGEDFEVSYPAAYSVIKAAACKIPEKAKHVAIFAENCPEWICAFYSAWKRGCTVVPVDASLSVADAAFIFKDSDTDFIYTSRANLRKAQEAVLRSGRNIEISLLDDLEKPMMPLVEEDWKIECKLCDLALIVYTSGTTNNPKGVMLTFDNLQANLEAVSDEGYYYYGMRTLAMLPFHHILPLIGTIIAVMYMGGSTVFPRSIAPSDIKTVMLKHKVTTVISVPRFYELIHANVKERVNRSLLVKTLFTIARLVGSLRFSKLIFGSVHKNFGGCVKHWVSGGAALDKQAATDLYTLGFNICEGYGMTECAPIISFPRPGRVKIGACGQPLPSNEVRIVDGEITVRGRSVTHGYYKRPDENEASFKNGWLYTGDLGYLDDEGFVFITGRRKEIIVLPNGKKLNPIELEMQIKERAKEIEEVGVLMYDDILQAVVRVTDEFYAQKGDESVKDFIRENAILPYNRANASYRRIMRFTISTAEFPRTRIGKLKRFQLASFIENINTELPNPPISLPDPDTRIYKELKDFMGMQVSVPVTADAHLEMDLALDSLGKISLQGFIKESYAVEMKEVDFEKYSTLREISEFVGSETEKTKDTVKAKYLSWDEILKNYQSVAPKVPKTGITHFFIVVGSKLFLKNRYVVSVEGIENVPPDPMIMAANHQSFSDGFLFAMALDRKRLRSIYFFAKIREMMKSSTIKYLIRHSNIVIVDIKSNVRESLQGLAEILRNGRSVGIFPEGTRTRDGEVSEFKQTFAILAKEMNVPVVPVVISGAYEGVKSRSSFPQKGTKIRMKFLPPVRVAESENYKDFAARVRRLIIEAKADMEGKPVPVDDDVC